MHIVTCVVCHRKFKSVSPRAMYCKKPECQEVKAEVQREHVRRWQRAHKRPTPSKRGQIILTETSCNWCKHHRGRCNVCGLTRQLNRFGLCLDCFRRKNNDIAGDGWIYYSDDPVNTFEAIVEETIDY